MFYWAVIVVATHREESETETVVLVTKGTERLEASSVILASFSMLRVALLATRSPPVLSSHLPGFVKYTLVNVLAA